MQRTLTHRIEADGVNVFYREAGAAKRLRQYRELTRDQ
jgi:hypothetical protein